VPPPAAEFLLAPLLARFLEQYKDIRLEISSEPSLQDIVAEGFDASIRVGQRVERDMVAVRVSGDLRAIVVASPDYLAKHGTPERPQDLREHNCIRFRFPRGLFSWTFEKKGKRIEVAVEGSVVTNDPYLGVRLAADGGGVFYMMDAYAQPLLDQGRLVSLLDDWAPPPDAFYLYYPSRRQNPAALQVLIEFLKANLRESDARNERRTK
jgi:DNA-binding transcriptional LysR family regulator